MANQNQQRLTEPAVSVEVSGTEVLVRAEGIVEAEVDGERILLSPADFSYFGLRGTGETVWGLIDGQRSLDDIVAQLTDDFEDDDADIRSDVVSFVEALKTSGLLL